ncbi:MAG: tyrosine-type recombinase/integrase [Nitrospirota bacterium]
MTFVKRSGTENVRDITLNVLREFFYEGKEVYQWSYSHYVNHRKYMKKFLDWCVKNGYLKANPALEINKPKKPQSLPRRLTDIEAQKILYTTFNYPWCYTFEMYRNYAILATFLYTGLRCKELLELCVTGVNLSSGNILVVNGKGTKDRNVPIHFKLKRILQNYVNEKKRLKKNSPYFFTGVKSNKPLSYKNASAICKKVSIEAGVKFTPHCLRHTFGSVSVEQGLNVVKLQSIMGHSSLASTMIYLKMSSKSLQESLNKLELF